MNTYELRPSTELFDNVLTNLSWSVAMVTAECAALCEQHDPAGRRCQWQSWSHWEEGTVRVTSPLMENRI